MKKLLDHKVGEAVDLFLFIKQSNKGVTQQGSPFMSLVLQDKSGDLEAKLWDTGEEQERLYAAGGIVRVGGEVHEYRGKNQLRIKSIRPARDEEGITLADLVPSAEKAKEELMEELLMKLLDLIL